MAKIVVTAIEQELRKKLDIKPEPGEERGVFLERLLRKGQHFTEAAWNAKKFSDAAEGWYNAAITAFSAASDPADIPEPPSKAQLAAAAEAEPEPEAEQVEEAAEEEPEAEAEEEAAEEAEAEEVEAEAEAEEDAPEDPDETEVEETDEMVETATARKPRAAAKTATAPRRAPPPPAKKAVPVKKAAAAPAKRTTIPAKVPARPVAKQATKPVAKKAAPAKKAANGSKPKPVIGSSSFVKNLLIDNPQLSVGELRAECERKSVAISDVTLSTIRSDFRHSLRALKARGLLPKSIPLEA